MKNIKTLSTIALGLSLIMSTSAFAKDRETGRDTGPVVYVTSQGLFYDSIVLADLPPMKGDFQQLVPDMNGLHTEFGPGEVGHLGGRWWIDVNGDNVMDEGDKYFLCSLLGPGRETI